MKSKWAKRVSLIFSVVMMLSVVSVHAAPYLDLVGPNVVQVGQVITYSVTTVGGTDSSYTWSWNYRTNNSATISEDGVLTTANPGIFGLQVYGNDTGAQSQLRVEIVPNEYGGVAIAGPSEVAVGKKITLTATTGGVPGSYYSWLPGESSSGLWYAQAGLAPLDEDDNAVEIEGRAEGWVEITAVDASGLSETKRINIVENVEKPNVSISAGMGANFTLALTLNIQGNIPADAILYIAVQWDGVIHYLPSLSTTPTPFRTSPTETYYENVLSVPLVNVPYNTYTFYAAIMDSQFQFVSNLAKSSVTAGTK